MPEAMDKVERVVREALKIACPDIGIVDGNTHLASELGLDSAQVMDMIMEIEDRLDISIPAFRLCVIAWSTANPTLSEIVPFGSPKNRSNPVKYWLNPATCVGSIV